MSPTLCREINRRSRSWGSRAGSRSGRSLMATPPLTASGQANGIARGRSSRRSAAPQCRKWRMPVKTMAMPRSSAAAITSSSRIEPPGWITAVAPASPPASRPSAKGKKASEATTRALRAAVRLARRLGRLARLPGGDARGIDPAHLAGADADGGAVLGIDDGVGLDVLGDAEGEQHVGDLAARSARAWSPPSDRRRRPGRCRGSGPGSRRRPSAGRGPAPRDRAGRRSPAGADSSCAASQPRPPPARSTGAITTSTNSSAIASAVGAHRAAG